MLRPLALLLAAAAALPARAEDAPIDVVVECADGSLIAGSLPAAHEFVLARPGGPLRLPLRDVLEVSVSTHREKETAELEARVRGLRDRLADDDEKVREGASRELESLPGVAAPFIAALAKDKDAEVAVRARSAVEGLRGRGQLQDPRDFVVAKDRPARGWLEFEKLEISTALGPVALQRAEIRRIARAGAAPPDLARGDAESWPPPLALRVPAPPLLVTVTLRDGSRFVGVVPQESLAFVDDKGAPVSTAGFLSATRDGAAYRIARRTGAPVSGSFAARELVLEGGLRPWKVPVGSIETVAAGAPRIEAAPGSFAALAREWLRAKAAGEPLPDQRFWVHIRNQNANPWNSQGRKLGMTWVLVRVHDQVALVGTDARSNAYNGDTSTEMELPILAVRKRNLAAPEGVDAADFYNGWSGAEVRMTRPVAGLSLKSLEAANAIIREEFGDGWEMAEFHHPQGGWHWWGYWGEAPEDRK